MVQSHLALFFFGSPELWGSSQKSLYRHPSNLAELPINPMIELITYPSGTVLPSGRSLGLL